MRRLHPGPPTDVDPVEAYASDPRPAHPGRPWLLVNMIQSLDGGTAVDGLSGSLGGPADLTVFRAIRAVPDMILVGAATARQESYQPPNLSDHLAKLRTQRGQAAAPRLAVMSRSVTFSPDEAWLEPTNDGGRPFLIVPRDAPAHRLEALGDRVDVIEAGIGSVDLTAALEALGRAGAQVVLSEGGPSVNGQLVADDLVDEICLSLSPALVAGDSKRIAHGAEPDLIHRFRLTRALIDDDLLFFRYVRPLSLPPDGGPPLS
ncbi:MAG: pyrimidine reductase family protein [Actinomycetia bacterium]|nr:pyrimidine reductase family protein [Actinomycetes bacterium]